MGPEKEQISQDALLKRLLTQTSPPSEQYIKDVNSTFTMFALSAWSGDP